jgi:hypothetical protein
MPPDYTMTGGKHGGLRTSFLTFAARQSDGTSWSVYVTPRGAQEDAPGEELARGLADAYPR